MSDGDLDIGHGGLVAVDTESLRAAADAASRVHATVTHSADRVQWAEGLLWESASAVPSTDAAADAQFVVTLLRRVEDAAVSLAVSLRQAASLYEASELRAAWLVAGVAERPEIEASLRAAIAGSGWRSLANLPRGVLFGFIDMREGAWRAQAAAPLARDAADTLGLLDTGLPGGPGPSTGLALAFALGAGVAASGLHTVKGPLQGTPDEVRVWVKDHRTVTAPADLAGVLARIPGDDVGRVRIERYDFPDGSREWLVYIAGTEGVWGEEPWDVKSDMELYAGAASASSAAVERALELAGRLSGEPMHLVGYSQGGIIAAHKAAADAAVPTLVTVATPVMAELPDTVMNIDLRHGDDPVAALSAQGPALGTGSSDSLVVRRTAPDGLPFRQLMDSHVAPTYRETAAQLDDSPDPRVEAMREVWRHLAEASTVTATTYGAKRVLPSAPGPVPKPSPGPTPQPPRKELNGR